eukprot:PhF_6_TR18895/c0_g1_i1/m.27533
MGNVHCPSLPLHSKQVVLVGLDGSGKTSLVKSMISAEGDYGQWIMSVAASSLSSSALPPTGIDPPAHHVSAKTRVNPCWSLASAFVPSSTTINAIRIADFLFLDLGGGVEHRGRWKEYISHKDTCAIAYVVDACDSDRLHEVASSFSEFVQPHVRSNPTFLILTSKSTSRGLRTSQMPAEEIVQAIRFEFQSVVEVSPSNTGEVKQALQLLRFHAVPKKQRSSRSRSRSRKGDGGKKTDASEKGGDDSMEDVQ